MKTNILIAVDSFKDSLSAVEASNEIELGIKEVCDKFNIKKVPISDGGEGTFEILLNEIGGEKVRVNVKNPLFENIIATYGILNDKTAIIEMASSSGLTLIPAKLRNPMNTTTYGVGEMIKDAINKGSRNFIIGIGGSATNDGGIGMLSALGFRFYDKFDKELTPIGKSLCDIIKIDANKAVKDINKCNFTIACDVNNPFYGSNGAACIFAKQKGANLKEVAYLDKGLRNFCNIIKNDFKIDISKIKRSGAAGGLGGAFKAFLNARLESGTDIIFKKLNIENRIKCADIVITGEGKLDLQTSMGKALAGISKLAKKYNKITIAISGSIEDEVYKYKNCDITSMFSIINSPTSLHEAIGTNYAKKNLRNTTKEIFKLILALND